MATRRQASPSSTARRSRWAEPAPEPGQAGPPDALGLLEADHRQVEKLFRTFARIGDDPDRAEEKEELVQTICRELTIHAAVEEEVFYPEARRALKAGDLLDEAEVEHACATALIRQIRDGRGHRDAEVHVLAEYVGHHIQEEEQQLFPRIRKVDLSSVATRMEDRRASLLRAWESGKPPRGVRALEDALGPARRTGLPSHPASDAR